MRVESRTGNSDGAKVLVYQLKYIHKLTLMNMYRHLCVLMSTCVPVSVSICGLGSRIELKLGCHLSRRRKVGVGLGRGEGWLLS